MFGGEGEQVPVADVLQLHGGEVLGHAAKTGQPRCPEDDVNVVVDVKEVGVDIEDVGVDAEWYTEGCSAAGDLVPATDEDGGVDALFLEADEAGDVDVDYVVRSACDDKDVGAGA